MHTLHILHTQFKKWEENIYVYTKWNPAKVSCPAGILHIDSQTHLWDLTNLVLGYWDLFPWD